MDTGPTSDRLNCRSNTIPFVPIITLHRQADAPEPLVVAVGHNLRRRKNNRPPLAGSTTTDHMLFREFARCLRVRITPCQIELEDIPPCSPRSA